MTFEQEVLLELKVEGILEELLRVVSNYRHDMISMRDRQEYAAALAPRVAAAIEAATYAGYEVEIERGRALGLAALRGTSGETP